MKELESQVWTLAYCDQRLVVSGDGDTKNMGESQSVYVMQVEMRFVTMMRDDKTMQEKWNGKQGQGNQENARKSTEACRD